jgi:hypothetical protein
LRARTDGTGAIERFPVVIMFLALDDDDLFILSLMSS